MIKQPAKPELIKIFEYKFHLYKYFLVFFGHTYDFRTIILLVLIEYSVKWQNAHLIWHKINYF